MQEIKKLSQLHPAILQLLKKRGIDSQEKLTDFFSLSLKELPSSEIILDIRKAAERLTKAIISQEKIAIYGDYDVDGTTSCALLYHFLKAQNITPHLIQPSRFVEGYGLHDSSIEHAHEEDITLIISVDCGITSVSAAKMAKALSIDLIITDHHQDAGIEIPDAFAIVNPNRRDQQENPFMPMAGVGVAFFLAAETKKNLEREGVLSPTIYPLLQFVAIGTICDMAKLTPLNRLLCRHGLLQLPKTEFPGLRAFLSKEERESPFTPSEKLSFEIGPIINSKGRLEHPEKALSLLIASDPEEARILYDHLLYCNKERQYIQKEVFQSAKDQHKRKLDELNPTIAVVYDPTWHEGVIGIVASKLVEEFKTPAIVLTNTHEEGVLKGSARSAGDLNLFELLNEVKELFIKFGGHPKAAGLSILQSNIVKLEQALKDKLKAIPPVLRLKTISYDLELQPDDITPKLLKDLEFLEPFGLGNDRPLFKMKGIHLASFDILKELHVRWNFLDKKNNRSLKGISFNYIGSMNKLSPHDLFTKGQQEGITIIFELGLNKWNGNEYIQLLVKELELGSL